MPCTPRLPHLHTSTPVTTQIFIVPACIAPVSKEPTFGPEIAHLAFPNPMLGASPPAEGPTLHSTSMPLHCICPRAPTRLFLVASLKLSFSRSYTSSFPIVA